jgi:uncharacterized protein
MLTGWTQSARPRRPRASAGRIAHVGQELVELFAYLHDCCREDDRGDPGHGERAAHSAEGLRGTLIHLADEDFVLLYEAIRDHELELTRGDLTVLTCWDADRLDLGRVGCRPNPSRPCTEYARRKTTIEWAYKRSRLDCAWRPGAAKGSGMATSYVFSKEKGKTERSVKNSLTPGQRLVP